MPAPDTAAALAAAAAHLAARRYAEARAICDRLLAAQPDDPEVLHVAGLVRFRGGDADAAIDHLTRSLELRPDSADVLANLGQMQLEMGNFEAAQGCFAAAVDLAPDDPLLRYRLALSLHRLEQYDAAETEFRRALQQRPSDVPAWYGLGLTLAATGRAEDAIAAYDQAVRLDPMHLTARSRAADLRLNLCRWEGIDRLRAEIVEPGLRAGGNEHPPVPLETLRLPIPMTQAELFTMAVDFARANQIAARPAFRFGPAQAIASGRRLRVGYVSSDFGDHPVGHILGALFEARDRTRFETVAYAATADDGSPARARIARAVDRLVDISTETAGDAARRINADGIDILVDLSGHTRGNRLEVLADRPAPVQATWLGCPGTLAVDFIDYLLVDPVSVPASEQSCFTERLVHLPETWFAVAADRAAASPRRAAVGLPDDGVVFCAFTLSHKIEPVVFGIWMRLLARVPGSVLWLRADNPIAIMQLERQAGARGVDAKRLVFAPRVDREAHLARHRAADLYLDTLFYNGHSTVADALSVGLPVVTFRGTRFPARVGASLLQSAGLADWVARTAEEYEALATTLATDKGARDAARQRLAAAQAGAPLFDPPRFMRHLEAGYVKMWEHHVAGSGPQPITIPAEPRR